MRLTNAGLSAAQEVLDQWNPMRLMGWEDDYSPGPGIPSGRYAKFGRPDLRPEPLYFMAEWEWIKQGSPDEITVTASAS